MVSSAQTAPHRRALAALSASVQRRWYHRPGWLWLLWPLECLYRLRLRLLSLCLAGGLCRRWRAPVPVLVVGNITVGGTGKTPVVLALLRALQQAGLRVGVVSRGYGAAPGAFPRRVLPTSEWRESGDEPLLIARQRGVPVVIAPRRVAAVRELLAWQTLDLVISDDGLQHWRLDRAMELVLIDAERGLGNGHCLPLGPLREPAARLTQVDHVLVRNGTDPGTAFHYEVEALVNLHDGRAIPPDPALLGADVDAMAGIGAPQQFFSQLRALGFSPRCHAFADHQAYERHDLLGFGGRPLIMTEKDAIKCAPIAPPDSWFLRIRASLPPPLIAQLCSRFGAAAAAASTA